MLNKLKKGQVWYIKKKDSIKILTRTILDVTDKTIVLYDDTLLNGKYWRTRYLTSDIHFIEKVKKEDE